MDVQSVGAPRTIGRTGSNRLCDGCLHPAVAHGLKGIAEAGADGRRELVVFYGVCRGSIGAGDNGHTADAFPSEPSLPVNGIGDGV